MKSSNLNTESDMQPSLHEVENILTDLEDILDSKSNPQAKLLRIYLRIGQAQFNIEEMVVPGLYSGSPSELRENNI